MHLRLFGQSWPIIRSVCYSLLVGGWRNFYEEEKFYGNSWILNNFFIRINRGEI